ncbi:MAG: radical SAM protein [Candidatus Peregrinibacteria bacterium]
MPAQRPYTYYDLTISLCPTCLKRVYGKIVFENDKVFMLKHCKEHGSFKVLIATDIEYYKKCRQYAKKSEMPCKFKTKVKYGCPYDCGLCEDHEQHSCSSVIEVTDRCNLKCPTCYASSSPTCGEHRTLEEIEKMFDIMVESEGEPDVVQISGGEPTIHPDFFAILDMAKTKPIKHLLLNTNGVRIATEEGFAERLATYMPQFEIYLQWDSLRPEVLKKFRGADLSEIRKKALEKLNALNLSTTLVVVVQKGANDDELGEIVEFAMQQPCVRGITFQPVQFAGRNEDSTPEDRITPTEVRQKIIAQQSVFTANDLIPVPCNPDTLTMAYGLKIGGSVHALTRYIDPTKLLEASKNTIVFERDEQLKKKLIELFSTGNSPESSSKIFGSMLCCLPKIVAPKNLKYDNIFRILIMHFQDAYDFDVRAIKKSCVHIVHKDGRIIPFETMNLFYRNNEDLLKTLQREDESFTF